MKDEELWKRLRRGLRRQQMQRLLRAEAAGGPADEAERTLHSDSGRTYVQPEGSARVETDRPETDADDVVAASGRIRPYCFALDRMRRSWREDDRRSDAAGRPAGETVGASEARRRWSELLHRVIEEGALVRIRHQNQDQPALLVRESEYRALERRAGVDAADPPDQTPSPP